MFKKLKEKITEEVKSSPQRFAEFTQSVSDRLQNSTTSDENFFSIGEDDANMATSSNSHGFSSVTLVSPSQENRVRTNSISSMASDVSFLPRYESGSMYHLQSDLDISASEIEDNVSTTSSQLGHLSKEQIYSAFQKSQMRYHKYRGRYTDLARHYKDLERENAKMKAVLVETQDKAIRRVTELKEQCNLEQKAKAHLESALRDELDEKNYKITTLQTKIELLQNEGVLNSLINVDTQEKDQSEDLDILNKYLTDARKEIENLNEKLQEFKANAIVFQSKELEYKTKISNMEKNIGQFTNREKENNMKLAQTKMELHNEILNKDAEITLLKKDNDILKQSAEAAQTENMSSGNTKLENLQSQNKKLIEKVENLTQKCNNLENESLKIEAYRFEIADLKLKIETLNTELFESKKLCQECSVERENLKQALNIAGERIKQLEEQKLEFDNQITKLRDDAKKGLLTLEPKIREKLEKEFLQKEDEMKLELVMKMKELSSNNNSAQETKLQLLEKLNLLKNVSQDLEVAKNELSKKINDYNDLEKNHLDLIDDCAKLRNIISNLEKEKVTLESYEVKISRLESHISTLQEELKAAKAICEHKEKENIHIGKENSNLQQAMTKDNEKLRILEEKYQAIHLESSESRLLELKLQKLEEEKTSLLAEFEMERKMFNEMLEDHKELREREYDCEILTATLKNCHDEIDKLKKTLANEEENNVNLFNEKLHFEEQVGKLEERIRIFEEKDEAVNLDKTECGILQLKLQKLEEEYNKLLNSFELERITLVKDLDVIKRQLSTSDENSTNEESDTVENNLKRKLAEIKQLSEAKDKENIILSKENFKLQRELSETSEKLRRLEEKLETVELESTECKLLGMKVQNLEQRNSKLLTEFEMERKMFNDLLDKHNELQEQKAMVSELQEAVKISRLEALELKNNLSEQKQEHIKVEKEKLNLEKQISTLEEKIRIIEEKDQAVNIEKTECSLLEMKLHQLEVEKQNLLKTFELERITFNKAYEESAKNEHQIKQLLNENSQVKAYIKKGKQEMEKLSSKIKNQAETYEKTIAENANKISSLNNKIKKLEDELIELNQTLENSEKSYSDELNIITAKNDQLKQDLDDKDKHISELSKNITQLSEIFQKQTLEFNNLLIRTEQLDSVLEKMREDSSEAIKKEKERQHELTVRIEELQRELEEKTVEFTHLNQNILELENLYSKEKDNYQVKLQEIVILQKKVAELEALEQSYKLISDEKLILSEELTRLKLVEQEKANLEKILQTLELDFKSKSNEFRVKEQENNILKGERDKLSEEIKLLRRNIEELHLENNNLKIASSETAENSNKLHQLLVENEGLLKNNESITKEMYELNIRMQAISSDNRDIVEENQRLTVGIEEQKIQLEQFENEKSTFDEVKNKLLEDNARLSNDVEETTRQLTEIQRQYAELIKEKNLLNTNEADIAKIQQDFYEIKEKCDCLFVENKNLKSEYNKLELKCNDFSKIKDKLETQIGELEGQYTELLHEKQLLQDEIQELKISPVSYHANSSTSTSSKLDQLNILKSEQALRSDSSRENYLKEIDILRDKLTKYKSLDITNKSSIEFYENELQKIKNQNDKLNRKLDETLVTLNHCAELSSSTEVEYLKNVLYNYMLGKESLVLARVIAAVCKFDPQQTETILHKEQQKQTLLGQLGLI